MEKKVLSVWSGEYWRTAAKEYTNLRSLCLAALFVAMYVALYFLVSVPISANRYLMVTYLAVALCMILCGPLVGVSAGIISDILCFIIKPLGAFFPGYTLSCMLGYVIFGLVLYRKHITVLRICIAKLVINVFVNVGLGCLWSSMMSGKAYLFYLVESVIKNLVLYPVEVILLCVLVRLLLPVMTQLKLIPAQTKLYWISAKLEGEK